MERNASGAGKIIVYMFDVPVHVTLKSLGHKHKVKTKGKTKERDQVCNIRHRHKHKHKAWFPYDRFSRFIIILGYVFKPNLFILLSSRMQNAVPNVENNVQHSSTSSTLTQKRSKRSYYGNQA